jgi:hypothetical protein
MKLMKTLLSATAITALLAGGAYAKHSRFLLGSFARALRPRSDDRR